MIRYKYFLVIIILLILFPYYSHAFKRELEILWPNTCGDICLQKNPEKRDGYSQLIYENNKYNGNFKNALIAGYGELEFSKGDFYKGNFLNATINGLGEYQWIYLKHKYIGSFKNDFLSGSGIYITPEWIINAKFKNDVIQRGKYYACNRIDGSVYITEKLGKTDVFLFSPNKLAEDFFPNQRKLIMETKRKLKKLYYYKGTVSTGCNGNLLSAIIEFYEDEYSKKFALNLLSDEFFVKNINSIEFQNKLNSAILRIN